VLKSSGEPQILQESMRALVDWSDTNGQVRSDAAILGSNRRSKSLRRPKRETSGGAIFRFDRLISAPQFAAQPLARLFSLQLLNRYPLCGSGARERTRLGTLDCHSTSLLLQEHILPEALGLELLLLTLFFFKRLRRIHPGA
jgi:hypothetical protein